MTIKTWREEFYPVRVYDLSYLDNTDVDLLEHCIRKWTGLTKENMEKHAVSRDEGMPQRIRDEEDCFSINDSTCALCKFYTSDLCESCPKFIHTGDDCGPGSSYEEWMRTGDPTRMITELKETLEKIK